MSQMIDRLATTLAWLLVEERWHVETGDKMTLCMEDTLLVSGPRSALPGRGRQCSVCARTWRRLKEV